MPALVDSSVWIDFFRGNRTPQTDYLYANLGHMKYPAFPLTGQPSPLQKICPQATLNSEDARDAGVKTRWAVRAGGTRCASSTAVVGSPMDGQNRSEVRPGMTVLIVLKKDQRSGKLTKGIVKDILTSSATHSRGIKVRLEDGQVGRVKEIVSP